MDAFTWNMHQFRFDSGKGRLKLGAVENEMEQSQASLMVLTEVCGSLAHFRAKGNLRAWLRARGFEAVFRPGRASRASGSVAVHGGVLVAWRREDLTACRVSGRRGRAAGGKEQKLDASAVGDYGIAVRLRRVRDGHVFSVVGHYGLPSGSAEDRRVENSRELAVHAAIRRPAWWC